MIQKFTKLTQGNIQYFNIFPEPLHKNPIILIVDDNQIINLSNKNIVDSILNQFNVKMDFLLCNDGLDIIEHISNEDYADMIKVIITDENMEYMSGSEAIRIVRTIESRKKNIYRKIICVTCQEDNKILDHIKKSGADYILTKPLLRAKISSIFKDIFFHK